MKNFFDFEFLWFLVGFCFGIGATRILQYFGA